MAYHRYEWKDRQGFPRVLEVFSAGTQEDVEKMARDMGWPGHPGGFWRYRLDEIRALYAKFLSWRMS